MKQGKLSTLLAASALVLASCGGGGGGGGTPGNNTGNPAPPPPPPPPGSTRLYAVPAQEALTVPEVQRIIAQAAGEAQARGLPSVIAVTDRVGNVLVLFRMNGARATARTSTRTEATADNQPPVDAQGLDIPAEVAAIAKAVTGAYLSSGGNAFSSRTASMIVQQHFPPAPFTPGLESGPLFGVQFSQLPCSDFSARFDPAGGPGALIGPKRSPFGLSADPGGFPLYKNGVLVGAIGVMGDGDYGFDTDVTDRDEDDEEAIALAGTKGFEPPTGIRADRIPVDGTDLRYSDIRDRDLAPLRTNFAAINGSAGTVEALRGYSDGTIIAGTAYGTEASGIRAATTGEFDYRDAFVISDGSGNDRFPIRGGTDGADIANPITAAEARAILEEAFVVMSRARAQIRRPLDSRAQVSISLVDTYGQVLGIVRAPDAPIFGTDVSLQKARTAAFFSSATAGAQLSAAGQDSFVQRVRAFLGDPQALTGDFAFSDRAGGNLSRPYFPDGEVGRPPGPFSRPIDDFNPFATGLQIQLVLADVAAHLGFLGGSRTFDTPRRCTALPAPAAGKPNRLANGIQIFPGSVPVYRGNRLIGGIGVSGDGIDQDDMISFLGLHNAAKRVGGITHAPPEIRADRIVVDLGDARVRLRFVNCPFAPFLDTDEQNVCQGL